MADHFGQSGTVVAHGEHTREIVVDGPGEDATEHYPQIGHRTELRTHDGAKDGTAVVGAEYALNKAAVEDVT